MAVRDILGGLLQVAGVRRDADTAEAANGAPHRMVFNSRGRLKVSGEPADYDPVTGSITANGQMIIADVSKCSNVVIALTGTFAGVNAVFEGSIDNQASWFPIGMVRTVGTAIVDTSTGALSAIPAYAWEGSVNALTNIRIRATAYTSGSANFRITLGSYATEPLIISNIAGGQVTAAVPTPSAHVLNTAATTNATSWTASAVNLFELSVFNPTASPVFVKLYNKASAPTVGTDVPTVTIPVAAGEFRQIEFGRNGKRYATGLALAVTAGAAATDTAAVGAGVQIHATRA